MRSVRAARSKVLWLSDPGPKNRYGASCSSKRKASAAVSAARCSPSATTSPSCDQGHVSAGRELAARSALVLGVERCLSLHDFDVRGFSIFGTLSKNARRFKFNKPLKVVDLGLRLADIARPGVRRGGHRPSPQKTRETLRRHGATEEEIEILRHRRVELNAIASNESSAGSSASSSSTASARSYLTTPPWPMPTVACAAKPRCKPGSTRCLPHWRMTRLFRSRTASPSGHGEAGTKPGDQLGHGARSNCPGCRATNIIAYACARPG